MDDQRVWAFEESLWTGDADRYRDLIDEQCLMVLPAPPFVFTGEDAIRAVQDTPRWSSVEMSEKQVVRPEEGVIVIAYHASARGEGKEPYKVHCTSVLRRLSHDDWKVIQHQQTPALKAKV